MEINGLALLGIVAMAGSLLIIPLGLPGLWIMLLILAVAAWTGAVSPLLFVGLLALAGVAEFLEWVALARLGKNLPQLLAGRNSDSQGFPFKITGTMDSPEYSFN